MVLDGPAGAVDGFIQRLEGELPPKARLDELRIISRVPIDRRSAAEEFRILHSSSDGTMRISIPADLAVCPDCMGEVFHRESRFYRYPFTTCTNCGPRYTVVEAMPYDRERTALKSFPLCDTCLGEYTDPLNRRFHAESIACPACGPGLFWTGPKGERIPVEDPLAEARRAIQAGLVVAVRGLGGFLLAADAFNRRALEGLRNAKHRPHKPFAVMGRNMEVIERECIVSPRERELLASSEAPIVVLRTGADTSLPVDLLAPGLGNLGVMLPTTPLHALLTVPTGDDTVPPFDFLLMTSGNRGGEPICTENEEAFHRLGGIADHFLCHDRGINLRNDDSLAVVNGSDVQIWRRARGYAPGSISLGSPFKRTVLAMGAGLKNTVCLGFDHDAVLSPHIGDLETPEALDGLELVARKFPGYFGRIPELIAVDLHPDMQSSRLGRKLAGELGVPVVEVQHHHAHALSAMCEHRLEEAIAIVFDGTGLGTDGTIWGGELLHVDGNGWERLGTFAPSELIGGDAAVLRPALQLIARFFRMGLEIDGEWASRLGVEQNELDIWRTQWERGLNTFTTHSVGRVFDAFSAGLGTSPARITYEGQAAILLEAEAMKAQGGDLRGDHIELLVKDGLLTVDTAPLFRSLHRERPGKGEMPRWAARFHRAMMEAAIEMALFALDTKGALPVVLSGGVMMNRYLATGLAGRLREKGIDVHPQRLVPPNDGGISLGQAYGTRRMN